MGSEALNNTEALRNCAREVAPKWLRIRIRCSLHHATCQPPESLPRLEIQYHQQDMIVSGAKSLASCRHGDVDTQIVKQP
jgi:hypothetical protein